MNRAIIDRYAAGADLPAKGIVGLTPAEMNSFPVPGTWSIQQIIGHLLDSDLIGADRMKRIIAEDNPLILAYDETRFAQRLMYEKLDPAAACDVIARNRALVVTVLRALPDDVYSRTGVHSQRGVLTLYQMVETYADHLEHHMNFLYTKRLLLGKPIAQ